VISDRERAEVLASWPAPSLMFRLLAELEAVEKNIAQALALHKRGQAVRHGTTGYYCKACSDFAQQYVEYPCETASALGVKP
jgi:hypothetical protein